MFSLVKGAIGSIFNSSEKEEKKKTVKIK